jgi:phosphoglycerate dehydrogenase-like enzyme
MTATILLGYDPGDVSAESLKRIRTLAPHMDVLVSQDRDEIVAHLDEIEVAARRFPRELLLQATRLRWFQQWGAGADWLLRHPEVADSDLVITNASGVHSIQITEHILAFLLAFARQLHLAVRAQVQSQWHRPGGDGFEPGAPIFELYGKTMLLIGLGAIGRRTAQVADALGVDVLGIRRNVEQPVPFVRALHPPEDLIDLLPQADFVVLTVPLTSETQGMIGEQALRAMKNTAYVVNIGRGGTIQEEVLVRALREGWIAGAGLDVFETEPLPDTSPLWTMDNVIITAHYSGRTPHYEERAMAVFEDNLGRYVSGLPLRNVVDKALGY